jgi:hypothetical protein
MVCQCYYIICCVLLWPIFIDVSISQSEIASAIAMCCALRFYYVFSKRPNERAHFIELVQADARG